MQACQILQNSLKLQILAFMNKIKLKTRENQLHVISNIEKLFIATNGHLKTIANFFSLSVYLIINSLVLEWNERNT